MNRTMLEPHRSELTRKRPRADEGEDGNDGQATTGEAVNGTLSLIEHRSKRLQSLPLRTSSTQKRCSGPSGFPAAAPAPAVAPPTTSTPTDSDSENVQLQQSNPSMDMDRDTDMMVDCSSEHAQLSQLQPSHVDPSVVRRMPSPIICTSAAQVQGVEWTSMSETPHAADGPIDVVMPDDDVESAQPKLFPSRHDTTLGPRFLGGTVEWSVVQNRRHPSPISERTVEDTPASSGMVLESRLPPSSHLQRPYLPHMPHSINFHGMAIHPNIQSICPDPDSDAGMIDADSVTSPSSAPATPSPRAKFGHSRSKHTLNSWTFQPGMKKSFSISYRADCEKCRQKIPGHFNHIIIS
ncbi:hypothetical protein GGR53DRAFT_143222 [Hypoxylon sp. FL1150]|nr:hypothetical protein GGR53DRAFT_143222 [Hypoxylon sp. FL1150]